ncbi:hypothetical protein PROP_01214 [Propionicimonas sp. T2.31MG-18]|uniref:COG4315 family predicted lipoprotein n=1 Tax=Propionicimonas sp. T2.31MG-18 TaxID=3157620 RepID=UPI0035E520D6
MFARSRLAMAVAPALCVVLLGACTATPATPAGAPAQTTAATAPPTPVTSPATADAATLALAMADTSLGQVLVDGKGMTLYLFTKDSANTSACTGACLVAWPPLIGAPTAGAGVDGSLLGSFTRQDGRVQATYNGWPLYYWKDDRAPGDVLGQNVNGVWFVLDRNGDAVKK